MADCDELFYNTSNKVILQISRIPEECQKTLDWLNSYRDAIQLNMKEFDNETRNGIILPKTPARQTKRIRSPILSTSSSNEENTSSQTNNQTTDLTDSTFNSSRPKRNAGLQAEKKINVQSQIKLNSKMRRPGKNDSVLNDISNNSAVMHIKSEKISSSPRKDPVPQIDVKKEPENIKKESMPPPTAKPKRGRKKRIKKEDAAESSDTENESVRSTRSTRSKQAVKPSLSEKPKRGRTQRNNRADSDVILQEVPVPLVVIDSDDQSQIEINGNKEKPKESETEEESTAERTGKKKIKKKAEKKTTKKTQVVETNSKDESLYEDALPIINKDPQNKDEDILKMMNCVVNLENIGMNGTQDLNVTHVKSSALNQTHILTKQIDLLSKTPNGIANATVVLERLDKTVILSNSKSNLNQTTVLSPREKNHEWKKPEIPVTTDNILTDDDSIVVKVTPEKKIQPPRKKVKTDAKTKPIFSPYANSPVRNRVAAFEKLVQSEPDQPTRVTRTKTRNLEKNKENQSSTESAKAPSKSRYFTPTANNKLPSMIPHSDSKIRPGTTKTGSAVKPSRADLQIRREEEQKKRLEKEEEAKRKREAIMQAKAEEQRKKREEKQLKAQKAREEMEREKEEKLRQMLQEKEEEQQKKREWQAKKLAEMEERKRLEEQYKLQKLKEQEKEKEKQRQQEEIMKKKKEKKQPPPLPTGDMEDSGSESDQPVFRKPKYIKPEWAQTKILYATMKYQSAVSQVHIKEWFHMEATTPDLQEIFENIDERYLRRNSSAVWRTPPRYSTLPKY